MKRYLELLIIGVVLLGTVHSCQQKSNLDQYNWLIGEWEFPGEDTLTFEYWEAISDTLYEGFNFKVHENDTIMQEHLWLESRAGKVILSAKVYGHNEDRRIFFDLDLRNIRVSRFVNHAHDFPTMIEYVHNNSNYLEVHLSNEDQVLPPIIMQRINPDGTFVE